MGDPRHYGGNHSRCDEPHRIALRADSDVDGAANQIELGRRFDTPEICNLVVRGLYLELIVTLCEATDNLIIASDDRALGIEVSDGEKGRRRLRRSQ
jgi:hypothetical protein